MSRDTVKIKALHDDYGDEGYKVGDIFCASVRDAYYYFNDNEGHRRMRHESEFELLSDERQPTIRTVTRKEIVPGKYGPVVIGGNGSVLLPQACYSDDELREAAHILNQIAEALEDV